MRQPSRQGIALFSVRIEFWRSTGEATIVRITEDGEVYNPVFRFMSRCVLGHSRSMDAYLRALGKSTGQEVAVTD